MQKFNIFTHFEIPIIFTKPFENMGGVFLNNLLCFFQKGTFSFHEEQLCQNVCFLILLQKFYTILQGTPPCRLSPGFWGDRSGSSIYLRVSTGVVLPIPCTRTALVDSRSKTQPSAAISGLLVVLGWVSKVLCSYSMP